MGRTPDAISDTPTTPAQTSHTNQAHTPFTPVTLHTPITLNNHNYKPRNTQNVPCTGRHHQQPELLQTPHCRCHNQRHHTIVLPDRLVKARNTTTRPPRKRSLANEFERLLPDRIGQNRPESEQIQGTGTIFPIRKTDIPKDRKVTYTNFQCSI